MLQSSSMNSIIEQLGEVVLCWTVFSSGSSNRRQKHFVLVDLDAKCISTDLLTSDMMGGLNSGYNAY